MDLSVWLALLLALPSAIASALEVYTHLKKREQKDW